MPDRLETLHQRIEDLTDPDGEYAVVCPRAGKRPVPVRGKSFPSPEVAAEAVDLVVEYRKHLREVDPHLERVPVVACEETAAPLALTADEEQGSTTSGPRTDERGRDRADGRERDRTGGRDRASDRVREDASGRASGRDPVDTVVLSGEGDDEWLRVTDAPVVRVREDGDPVDDAVVGLELNAKL